MRTVEITGVDCGTKRVNDKMADEGWQGKDPCHLKGELALKEICISWKRP